MTRSLLFTTTLFSFIVIACSSATTENDETLGSADDELKAAKACQNKSCGEACTLCPPNAAGCVETAVLKACNAKGKCTMNAPACGGTVDAGPAPYQPCGGQVCGASCSLCPPNDPNCVETAVLKFCHANGECLATTPACSPPPPPPPPHQPCANKTCGALCSLCAPSDPNCVETAVLKFCHANGDCQATPPACVPPPPPPPYQPCANKVCGASCTICDPTDPNCVETAVLKQCNAAGQCTMNTPVCN